MSTLGREAAARQIFCDDKKFSRSQSSPPPLLRQGFVVRSTRSISIKLPFREFYDASSESSVALCEGEPYNLYMYYVYIIQSKKDGSFYRRVNAKTSL